MEEKIYMPKKRKAKKKEIIISIAIVVLLTIAILIINSVIKTQKYHKTYEYKLLQIGYNTEEVKILLDNKEIDLDYILTLEYNKYLSKIINEKYYLNKNLDAYLNYLKDNGDKSLTDVVAIINVGSNKDWYIEPIKTDTSKDTLLLVNKFNYVDKLYIPDDLTIIKNWYAYGENQKLRKVAYDSFISMYNVAKKQDLTLIINSAYRSYEDQEETYNDYLSWYGKEYTDGLAAHPGYSEHQTGLAIDIMTPGYNAKTFEESDEFKWLKENAHLYGYILRYPSEYEYLTGYAYESWHYRYVGEEVAKYIYDNKITYDEYYAYFINK